ncbi:YecA family protein [Pseudoxanthomonas sp. SGD-10]|uniref:UPF0149 family protein n=1 Tax=unclassified Pseudoxanthomonas TaxID=2645906 RepID=UPI00030AFE91|nr:MULTISPECIES: UPF0149 family protein [unclassified Pseudoxanthomonas]RRN78943.1 YecA family protein [Pseudoxanthomonas sp. SGD-10]
MATPPPYLDDAQIERLSTLLEQRAVPFRGFNLEALDGFLSALAVAPAPVPPEEWQPVVWGGKLPSWGSPEEAEEVQALLQGHWNMCVARARQGEDLPEHLLPLMWLPEDPESADEALAEDELDVGREWALGFFEGAALREEAWDRWLDEHEWIEEIFDLLERLASGEVVDPEHPEKEPVPLAYRERLDIVMDLPGMLADLNHQHIAEQTPRTPIRREDGPGRNDPCPCGSGKKHKKCCGAG